jgi:hypothetical protein
MKIRVILRVIVCGLLLTLLVPAAEVEAAKRSKQRVKIGVLVSLTGSWSSLGKNTVAALRIAAAESTTLDAAGDRLNGDFDFWAVRLRDGNYTWVRVGTYNNGFLTVF